MSPQIATAPAEAPRPPIASVAFPSTDWFEKLGDFMKKDRVLHEHLGDVECVAQFTVKDGRAGAPWNVLVTFDGFEVTSVCEVGAGESDQADFVVEADLATWRHMIESIADGHGRRPLDQTLNFLSLPETPVRAWSKVDATYEVPNDFLNRFAIRLEDCIDCGFCIPLCPVDAIHDARAEGIVKGEGGYAKISELQAWAETNAPA